MRASLKEYKIVSHKLVYYLVEAFWKLPLKVKEAELPGLFHSEGFC